MDGRDDEAADRWHRLFADLQDELDGLTALERDDEAMTRARIDLGRRALAERVAASIETRVRISLPGALVDGVLADAGPDWLLLDRPSRLVALTAVQWIDGLATPALAPPLPAGVGGRFDLRLALRRLCRRREPVVVCLCDSTSHAGTIDRVGADHLDLALHAEGDARRAAAVRGVRCVPLAALASVCLGVSP